MVIVKFKCMSHDYFIIVAIKQLFIHLTTLQTFYLLIVLNMLGIVHFVGSTVVCPGAALGDGLTHEAAVKMDLKPYIPVAAGLIDAHCGKFTKMYYSILRMILDFTVL